VKPVPARLAPMAAAALLAVGASACGREEAPDMVKGKTLFVQRCGSCHILNRANTTGVQGPNLDQAFGPARSAGESRETVEGIVKHQIAFPRKDSSMPKNLVKGAEAADVAAYVALVAGQPGQDTGELAQAGRPNVANKTATAKNGKLEIDADPTGALSFLVGKAIAPAAAIEFVMKNRAPIQHNIAIQGPVSAAGPVVGTGGTSTFKAALKPGKYTFLCTVPGHADGGMKGTLLVK
jgi:mono/diheme cytochrome c family protein